MLGMAVLMGDLGQLGDFTHRSLTLKLKFSCFCETSKRVRGAYHAEKGGILGGGFFWGGARVFLCT